MRDRLLKAWSQERFNIPVKIIASYVIWKLFYHFIKSPGTALGAWWDRGVYQLGAIYAAIAAPMVRPFMDYAYARGIDIYLTAGPVVKVVIVEERCLAIPAMVIFTATVIFFKGRWQDKLWFIPLGLLGVAIINLVRIVSVCITFLYASAFFFAVNHSIIYVILCYSFIFAMLAWWIHRNRHYSSTNTAK